MKNNAFELTNYALKLNLPFLGLAQHRGRTFTFLFSLVTEG